MRNVGRSPENMSKSDYSELRRTYEEVDTITAQGHRH